MSFVFVFGMVCEILYESILVSMLIILLVLIEFVFNLVFTQFQSCTNSMAVARVGDHRCDVWTVFNDCSAFKQLSVIDSSILFNSLMSNCDII